MSDHAIPHSPGLHCHHNVEAVECTMCTYLAMERAHNRAVIELIKRESGETTPQVDEESQSAGLGDTANQG